MARKFLYVVAILIVLALAAAFAYRMFGKQILEATMVPSARFVEQKPVEPNAYAAADMWYARPDRAQGNPSLWTPQGFSADPQAPAAVFFIHPTSYINKSAWNAPLGNAEAENRARVFIKGQATVFNDAGQVWAPKYRQATFGAFLTTREDARKALDAAYADVLAAFDQFLVENPKGPIILAGHSQGSLHLTHLLRDRIAGTPLAKRIVAAYVVGWPVSVDTDLPEMGLPACETAGQANCILSWQSFAEPADPSLILDNYNGTTGFTGEPRKGTRMLCTNPLTGAPFTEAGPKANLGMLVPNSDLSNAELKPQGVGARCSDAGFLMIGDPPDLGPYVLPGNNYHVYDYSLFWANIRKDVEERLKTFQSQSSPQAWLTSAKPSRRAAG